MSLSAESVCILVATIGFAYTIRIYWDFRQAVKGVQGHPGHRTLISQATVFSNFPHPSIPGVDIGYNYIWRSKHESFIRAGWDVYAHISAWPRVRTLLVLADATAIRDVISSRSLFPKPVHQYKTLTFFGENIVASEGTQWKRYRKLTAPAFTDRNNRLVWDETVKIVLDLFNSKWGGHDEVTVEHFADITRSMALSVISVAGFGRRISWSEDSVVPHGHQMSFKDALRTMSNDVFLKVFVPNWAHGLTKRLRTANLAFDELEQYMLEMIHARRSGEEVERYDLFTSLLEANEDEAMSGDEAELLDSELLGNLFIFVLAGYETTAHTMCFAFAMLAMYPEEQETLYQQIKKVVPNDRLPTYEDMPHLTQALAVFYETLRMFPSVIAIPKHSAEDTVLSTGNLAGEQMIIPVPEGTEIIISTPGLHYNPRYWEDPYSFKPARFLKDWPRDAFLPFSAGARGCLGRKFAETEATAVLTMLLSRFKVEVKEEPEFAGETFEERFVRITRAKPGLSLTPVRVPLVFKRR